MTMDCSRKLHIEKRPYEIDPPDTHRYYGVYCPQGTVHVDELTNTNVDIVHDYSETSLKHVIGKVGCPLDNPGFRIEVDPSSGAINIGAGYMYCDGMGIYTSGCRLDAQPYQPPPPSGRNPALPDGPGLKLAYVDVTVRPEVTFPGESFCPANDPALGGIVASVRTEIVWQVKLFHLGPDNENGNLNCSTIPHPQELFKKDLGKISVRVNPTLPSDNPCDFNDSHEVENQHYMIRIYNSGRMGNGATCIWNRNNGSVTAKIVSLNDKRIIITTSDRDRFYFSGKGLTVEITDDAHILNDQPGPIATVNVLNETSSETELEIVNVSGVDALTLSKFPFNPRVRLWDSKGIIPIENRWMPMEDNIEVKFEEDREYVSGDYVSCVSRKSINNIIDWPTISGEPVPKYPDGIIHHYAKLALLQVKEDGTIEVLEDCRKIFPPLTELPGGQAADLKTAAIHAHGNIVWAEDEERLDVDNKAIKRLKTSKQRTGTTYRRIDSSLSDNWFHFPISLTSLPNDDSLKLNKFYLLYKTPDFALGQQDIQITKLEIYDGKHLMWTGDFENLLHGDHSSVIDSLNIWSIETPFNIKFGLEISAQVQYISEDPTGAGVVEFCGVGAEFIRTE